MLYQELRQLWRIARAAFVIVGVLLSFFAVMEVLRAYLTLRDINSWLGTGFAVLIVAVLVAIVAWFARQVSAYPRTLRVPPRPQTKRYARYLARYLQRLEQNPALEASDRALAAATATDLLNRRKTMVAAELETHLRAVETDTIDPIVKQLDRQVDQKIRAGVRDIMIAVTVSPYRSTDLFIVVYRNLVILQDIMRLYRTRPALREALAIAYDTARVVATVNFVNLGAKMMENISRGLPSVIPGVNRLADDCAQGLAAGLLTSVAGHAARDRCRAYRRWDYEQARANIANHLKTFTADVGKMFFADIVPHLRVVGGFSADKIRDITEGVARGFNETIDAIGNFVRTHTSRRRERTDKPG